MTRSPSSSALPLRHLRRGKVREVYEVDDDRLLLVATDRVSAFDVVMARARSRTRARCSRRSPRGGCGSSSAIVPHHMLSADADEIVGDVPSLARRIAAALAGRAMLVPADRGVSRRVRRARLPLRLGVEGVPRSAARWPASRCRRACGRATASIRRSSARPPRPRPVTTRTSPSSRMATTRRAPTSRPSCERLSRLVYERGRDIAAERGIIIADTKFEFGRDRDGKITLIDEVLTPDSSRFWPADRYAPGARAAELRQAAAARLSRRRAPRGTLERRRAAARRCREAVVDATSARYLDAFRRITGATLDLTESTRELRPRRTALHRHRGAHRGRRVRRSRSTRRSWPLWLLAFALDAHRALGRVLLPRSGAHAVSAASVSSSRRPTARSS